MKILLALAATSAFVMSSFLPTATRAAESTPAPYVSYNFEYKNKTGSLDVSCLGTLLSTPPLDENSEPLNVCDGSSVLTVTWNAKRYSKTIDTSLPHDTTSALYSRPEEYGVLWYSPRVINGTLKRFLVIQNNTWDNVYGGVGGAPSRQTFIFNFDAGAFSELVNPTGRKLYWNKAGTRAFFVANNCGGAGCEATSPLMGITLTSKQSIVLTKTKAAFSHEFSHRNDVYHQAGKETPIQTWKSAHWINDRMIEAQYLTATGATKTLRVTF